MNLRFKTSYLASFMALVVVVSFSENVEAKSKDTIVKQVVKTKKSALSKSSTQNESSKNIAIKAKIEKNKKLTSILYGDISSNMYKYGATSNRMSSTMMAMFKYELANKKSATVAFTGSKDLTGLRESAVENAFIAFKKADAYKVGKTNASLELRNYIILNETQRKNQYKRGQLRLSTGLNFKVSNKTSLSYGLRASKHFYKFKQSRTGIVNTNLSAAQTLGMIHSYNDRWSLTLTATHGKKVNYSATTSADSISLSQEIGFQATKRFGLALGHAHSDQLIDTERGADGVINLYDDNSSTVYTSMTYIF
jgi:hypothetical protein